MCLVFLAFRTNDDNPLLVGANREESRRRPSTPPIFFRCAATDALLAGIDRGPEGSFAQIGTWLGVNSAGVVVAVTNRRDGDLAWEDLTRSRGVLAVSLLDFHHPETAVRFAEVHLSQVGYGACNYLIANRDQAFVVQASSARRISVVSLAPGIHAMTNLDVDDRDDARVRIVHEELEPGRFAESARRICRDERIVIAGGDRGTVSSSLVQVGGAIRFEHIQGDPRDGEYEAFSLIPAPPEASLWPSRS